MKKNGERQWYIEDIGSSSGTFLNDKKMSILGKSSHPFPLNSDDVVKLGEDFRTKDPNTGSKHNNTTLFVTMSINLVP